MTVRDLITLVDAATPKPNRPKTYRKRNRDGEFSKRYTTPIRKHAVVADGSGYR